MRAAGRAGRARLGPGRADDEALSDGGAPTSGFPLLVKPSAGGGGKGMSRVDGRRSCRRRSARRGAWRASPRSRDDTVYLEKLLERPHHIEFQIFGDEAGHVVHLFERECSVQRRHQKIVEETPSPALDAPLRSRMAEAAVEAARAVGYVGAGTVELLLDEKRNFYFLEMNTRLQVEHPITEATLGIDLVRAQLEIAAGRAAAGRLGAPLARAGTRSSCASTRRTRRPFCRARARSSSTSSRRGRACASIRESPGARASGVEFDPLLAKLIVFAPDRRAAIERGATAPSRTGSCWASRPTCRCSTRCSRSEEFQSGRYTTDLLSRLPALETRGAAADAAWIAAARLLERPVSRAPSRRRDRRLGGGSVERDLGGWRPGG